MSGGPSAGTPRRSLASSTALYAGGAIAARLAALVMLPVYTRVLTTSDYGVLQLVQTTLEVIGIAVSAGMTSGVMRFFFKAESEREQAEVISTAWMLICGLNFAAALALLAASSVVTPLLLGPDRPARLLAMAGMTFALDGAFAVVLVYMQATHRAGAFMIASLTKLALQLGLNAWLLLRAHLGVEALFIGNLTASAVTATAASLWMFRQTGFRPRRTIIGPLRRFGLPNQLAYAGSFILTFGDRYFLRASHGLAEVGVYGLAYQFGFMFFSVAASPFVQAWTPRRYAQLREPEAQRTAQTNRDLLRLTLLLSFAGLGTAVVARPLLMLVSKPEFTPPVLLIPIIVMAYVLQAWTDVAQFGIDVSEQTRFSSLGTWISVAVVLLLYALLIPPLGGIGAALATLGAFAVRLGCYLGFAQRLTPIAYRPARALAAVGLAVALAAAALVLGHATARDGLAAGAAAVLLFVALAWRVVLPAEERIVLLALLRRRRVPEGAAGG